MRRGNPLREAARMVYGEEKASLAIRSMDIIGDIAVIKVPDELMDRRFEFAEKVVELTPSVETVFRQKGPVSGSYRLRELEFLAGRYKTLTLHREYGCSFYVDVARTYYTPRLSTERWRITNMVGRGEVVLNMFAGVGPYSIMIAKHREVEKVYSIDINYDAVKLHRRNIRLNKVEGRVEALIGDAWDVIFSRFCDCCARVLMPLPERALEYLDAALAAISVRGWIHVYLHVPYKGSEEEALSTAAAAVKGRLGELGAEVLSVRARRVREVGTRLLQVCVDAEVSRRKAAKV
ncbi:methyltransferase [Candidatus Geothermarchaeota archaeon ex4572_27]|nr:MAG: methyltransferase [Candidatus Geothermarchaeota archaeon ex4572_27]